MFRVLLLVTSLTTGNDSIWMNGPLYSAHQRATCVTDARRMERAGTSNEKRRAVCLHLDSVRTSEQTERFTSGTSGEAP